MRSHNSTPRDAVAGVPIVMMGTEHGLGTDHSSTNKADKEKIKLRQVDQGRNAKSVDNLARAKRSSLSAKEMTGRDRVQTMIDWLWNWQLRDSTIHSCMLYIC
jgi:hypothetical protein